MGSVSILLVSNQAAFEGLKFYCISYFCIHCKTQGIPFTVWRSSSNQALDWHCILWRMWGGV